MSIQPNMHELLAPHLGDRIRKALEVGDVTVQEMAAYLDVNRNTVSAWINMRNPPSTQSLRLIALKCGVPFKWLETGEVPSPGGDGTSDDAPRTGLEPVTLWGAVSPSQGLRLSQTSRARVPVRRIA